MKKFSNHMAEQFRGKFIRRDRRIISHLLVSPPDTSLIRLWQASGARCQRDAQRCRNRSNQYIHRDDTLSSGAAATLSQLPEVFLETLKQYIESQRSERTSSREKSGNSRRKPVRNDGCVVYDRRIHPGTFLRTARVFCPAETL